MLDRLLGRNEDEPEAILATTDGLPGFTITETLSVVGAAAGDEPRALRALARRGAELDADAVVAVRVASTATGSFWMASHHTFAYGTAVRATRGV